MFKITFVEIQKWCRTLSKDIYYRIVTVCSKIRLRGSEKKSIFQSDLRNFTRNGNCRQHPRKKSPMILRSSRTCFVVPQKNVYTDPPPLW